MNNTTIGLDIAKNVFQVHVVDAKDNVVLRKVLKRRQVLKFFANRAPSLIGMEACAGAYWESSSTGRQLGGPAALPPLVACFQVSVYDRVGVSTEANYVLLMKTI